MWVFFFSQHLILSRYSATTDACCQYNSGAFKSDAAVYTNVTTFLLCCLFLPPPALKQFCMRIRQELTSQKYIRTVVIRLLRVYRSRRRRLKYIKNKNGNQWFGWVAWWKTTKVSRDLHDLDGTTIVDRCDFCQLERHQGPHDNRL